MVAFAHGNDGSHWLQPFDLISMDARPATDGLKEPIYEVEMNDNCALDRLPDDQLLREASNGNTDALHVFFVKRLPTLLRFAKHHCFQQHVPIDLADDFCHDGIIDATRHLDDVREHQHRPFPKVSEAWLKTIIYRRIVDHRRKHQRCTGLDYDVPDTRTTISPADREESEKILKFFRWLSDNERDMLEMIFVEELDFGEAAERLNLSYWAANKAFHRGLEHLRDLLKMHGESLPAFLAG